MKTRMLFLIITLTCFAFLATPMIATAQGDPPTENVNLTSGLLNFTRGQSVAIHFCNIDRVTREIRMYMLDTNGNTLKTVSTRVLPGQSVSISFSFDEMPRTGSKRVGIRGAVVVLDPPDPDADPPSERSSLANMEVYDTLTGKTTFGLPLIVGDPTALPVGQ